MRILSGVGYTANLLVKFVFEKGYKPNWTGELFIISERIPRRPYPVYRVKDLVGEKVAGTFYGTELRRVSRRKPR